MGDSVLGKDVRQKSGSLSQYPLFIISAIQPLNPKNLESSFPPNYSRFPIPIGIRDSLFKDPTISSN